jgi:trk system potassium uptake protein TrkA
VIYEKLGIHTVATVPWSTSRVLHRLLEEDDGPDWTDPSARIALVERPVTRRWVGATVAELAVPGTVRVTGLSRHGQGLVPVDDMVLEDGDVAWLAVPTDSVDAADRHLRLGPDKGTLP